MIVQTGKDQIRRFFAGETARIADTMVFGVGTTSVTNADTKLAMEIVRVPITSINADMANGRVVFKSSLNPGQIKTIYEMALYSNPDKNTEPGRTLAGLFNGPGIWSNATYAEQNARANTSALKLDYVSNGTTTSELFGLAEDLSSYIGSDQLAFAFYPTANLSSIRFRLGTDSSNYYEFAVTSGITQAGYNIVRVNKSTATTTGSPDWSSIRYVAVRPSATAGGPGSVYFDGIRLERGDQGTSRMVARVVLSTPKDIDTAIPTEIEYAMGINIT